MILDLTRFRSGRDPLHGLLTILEEIPGYMHSADLTSHLIEHGYWGSYNNPYFEDISALSGNADLCLDNSITCYNTDPRANLFRKHQSSVSSLGDMQWLMGLNEFASDPLSLNDSCNVSLKILFFIYIISFHFLILFLFAISSRIFCASLSLFFPVLSCLVLSCWCWYKQFSVVLLSLISYGSFLTPLTTNVPCLLTSPFFIPL